MNVKAEAGLARLTEIVKTQLDLIPVHVEWALLKMAHSAKVRISSIFK